MPVAAGSISPIAPSVSSPGLIVPPEPERELHGPPLVGLVGAGVAAGGAGLMAALLGQPLFALFGAIGALASVATWAAGAGAVHHRRHVNECRAVVYNTLVILSP